MTRNIIVYPGFVEASKGTADEFDKIKKIVIPSSLPGNI